MARLLCLLLIPLLPTAAAAAPATELPPEELTRSYVGPERPPCPAAADSKGDDCVPAAALTDRVVTDAVERREVPDMTPALPPPTALPPEPALSPLQQQIIRDFVTQPPVLPR